EPAPATQPVRCRVVMRQALQSSPPQIPALHRQGWPADPEDHFLSDRSGCDGNAVCSWGKLRKFNFFPLQFVHCRVVPASAQTAQDKSDNPGEQAEYCGIECDGYRLCEKIQLATPQRSKAGAQRDQGAHEAQHGAQTGNEVGPVNAFIGDARQGLAVAVADCPGNAAGTFANGNSRLPE